MKKSIYNADLSDFPQLTDAELRDMTMRIYQLKQEVHTQMNIFLRKNNMKNKITASIILRHSNYFFMYKSYRCENVCIENDGGTDNNSKPDLDNINGQITILNRILIISMHIASLVKRPCYLLKLSFGNGNMGVSRADNSVNI